MAPNSSATRCSSFTVPLFNLLFNLRVRRAAICARRINLNAGAYILAFNVIGALSIALFFKDILIGEAAE